MHVLLLFFRCCFPSILKAIAQSKSKYKKNGFEALNKCTELDMHSLKTMTNCIYICFYMLTFLKFFLILVSSLEFFFFSWFLFVSYTTGMTETKQRNTTLSQIAIYNKMRGNNAKEQENYAQT